jgi:hypothetical protein
MTVNDGNYLGAAVVAVEARLGYEDADGGLSVQIGSRPGLSPAMTKRRQWLTTYFDSLFLFEFAVPPPPIPIISSPDGVPQFQPS